MAYETKALLIALADSAAKARSKEMYKLIARMAGADGVKMQSYDEAVAEIEADENERKADK